MGFFLKSQKMWQHRACWHSYSGDPWSRLVAVSALRCEKCFSVRTVPTVPTAPLIYITPWSFKASDCNPWLRNALGFSLTTSRSEGSPPHPQNVLLSGFWLLLSHLPNCPFIFTCLYFSPFYSTSKKVTRENWHRLCSPASISIFFSSLSLYFLLFWSLPKSLVKRQ